MLVYMQIVILYWDKWLSECDNFPQQLNKEVTYVKYHHYFQKSWSNDGVIHSSLVPSVLSVMEPLKYKAIRCSCFMFKQNPVGLFLNKLVFWVIGEETKPTDAWLKFVLLMTGVNRIFPKFFQNQPQSSEKQCDT